jgi:Protein of unknown function (DUF2735)
VVNDQGADLLLLPNESRLRFNKRDDMNTSFHHGSAKIYQFPVRGRPAIGARYEQAKTAVDIKAPAVSEVASGSGWYHQAAIDAERTGEH